MTVKDEKGYYDIQPRGNLEPTHAFPLCPTDSHTWPRKPKQTTFPWRIRQAVSNWPSALRQLDVVISVRISIKQRPVWLLLQRVSVTREKGVRFSTEVGSLGVVFERVLHVVYCVSKEARVGPVLAQDGGTAHPVKVASKIHTTVCHAIEHG